MPRRLFVLLMPILILACFFIWGAAPRAAATVLYQENFSGGQAENWQEQADPSASWRVQDGKYYLNIPPFTYRAQAQSIYQNGFAWQDYVFSFDAELNDGVDRNVIFRRQDEQNYYLLGLRGFWRYAPDDTPVIYLAKCYQGQCVGADYWHYFAAYHFTDNKSALNNETSHFDIEAMGSSTKVYYNRNLVIDWQEPSDNYPKSGTIGFNGWSGDYGAADVAWDNLIVQAAGHEEPARPEPVIIVPGIMGSYLNRDDADKTEVWPNILKMLIPGDDSYLNELTMTTNGYPDLNNPTLMPTDIIRQIATDDYYQGLITELRNNGYEENKNLFVFPYDWRWFLNWSAAEDPFSAIQSLKEKIDEVKSQTGAMKVNIIAHSLGGLAAKYYLKHYGANSVDKFIDIGTPHLGAPNVFKKLMYGDDLDINVLGKSILNSETIKTISQNIPSVYQLLPSRNYFTDADKDYSYYIYDLYDLDNNGATGRLDYAQSIDFLKNTGRNNYLLNFNDVLHNDLDNYSPVADGVKTYNIVGCGRPTIGQIFVLNKEKSGKYEYGLKYISGDGTVPLRSAEALAADDDYYMRNGEHSTLPSAQGVKQLVSSILNDAIAGFSLTEYPEMSHNSADCSLNGTQISFHSPIELNIYDENNNHVGPIQNGDIDLGIRGAQYDDLDGNKFVFLPTGYNYRVVGQATANGSFNARVQTVQNGQYIETVYYNQVPLNSSSTVAQLQINNGQPVGSMEIDQNGDQIFETQVEPSAVLNQAETADLVKPETQVSLSGSLGNNDYYISTTAVILTATDNQGGSGILKIEYSLDNGQSRQNYQSPIIFNIDGQYNLLYKSTDRAGNVEEEKVKNIKIDKTAPAINILLPLDNQEFSHDEIFTPEYEITDNYSGAATGSLVLLLDGQPISQAEQDLFYYSLGQHVLKIIISDLAGNQAEASVKFTVSADLDSTISDVNRSYNLGWISNEKVKNWLNQELNEIKKYQEKFGIRLNKLEQKREKIMSQCLKKKNQVWCEEKLKEHYDRAVYKLGQNYRKTIIKRYRQILKKLDNYYGKQWLNRLAYDMIKADVEYLISNL